MKVSEVFCSIQGEGKLMGLPSAFVRVSGCNLRCSWCDSPYASWQPQGQDMTIDDILQRVAAFPTRHVVLTGGEPMIMPDLPHLCAALKATGYHLTLETAATVYTPVHIDLASISPKLANSTPADPPGSQFARMHEQQRLNPPVIQQFIDASPDFQLKFVVSSENDLPEIQQILASLRGWRPADVLLMPEGTHPATLVQRAPWIVEACKQTGYRYCPRLHIQLYGHRRGI